MSEQRRARQRRREERRMSRQGPAEPQKRSFLDKARDFLQQNGLRLAGGLLALGLVVVIGLAVYYASTSENTTSTEEAEAAEMDASPGIPGEFLESEGRQHVPEDVTYQSSPPTSGPHDSVPLPPGVYRDPTQAPEERAVHSMEHGSVIIWYNCEAGELNEEACTAMVDDLKTTFVEENRGSPSGGGVVVINYPEQENFISITGWTRLLRLDELDEAALEEFIDTNLCRFDPESICD